MKGFLDAIRFLTVLPVGKTTKSTEDEIRRSIVCFPLVGLLIGLILVFFNEGLIRVLPRGVTDILLVTILVYITGGLHLDGLADTIDGLAGGKDKEGILRIMRDSQLGAMGAMSVAITLLIKYLTLTALPETIKKEALILMPVVGRWSIVYLCFGYNYAREKGLGNMFVGKIRKSEFFMVTAITGIISLICGFMGLLIMGIIFICSALFALFFKKKIGGVTGDVLGASNEISEIILLIMICALRGKLS